jgi:hypothetical protein
MKTISVAVVCVLMVFSGCNSQQVKPVAKAEPMPDVEKAATMPAVEKKVPTPAIGEVKPSPKGCLDIEFFAPSDDSRCSRDQSGRINMVVTPTKRNESLVTQWTTAEIEKAIRDPDKYNHGEHFLDRNCVPGPDAWSYVKQYLRPDDEIWTLSGLDFGFVILRNNKLFCMVITDHQR